MKTLFIFLATTLLATSSFASGLPGFNFVANRAVQEDDVTFLYTSNDGTFELKCTHVYDNPEASDWDVWCGKGTKMLKQFRVHFLVRQLEHRTLKKSAYEVLYWVIDRSTKKTAFSSTSTWLQFNNISDLDMMSFSQGVENDYAYLTVTFKPRR